MCCDQVISCSINKTAYTLDLNSHSQLVKLSWAGRTDRPTAMTSRVKVSLLISDRRRFHFQSQLVVYILNSDSVSLDVYLNVTLHLAQRLLY